MLMYETTAILNRGNFRAIIWPAYSRTGGGKFYWVSLQKANCWGEKVDSTNSLNEAVDLAYYHLLKANGEVIL